MKRDPFYGEILDRLGQPLDPDVFERCACDLLRVDFPSLVPVRGGVDSGMDGAIADGEGPAFPLICTTSNDVLGNLRKNLNSHLKSEGTRRKAVVATSQALTPAKRQNLVRCGTELGFDIVQIYDRAAFADRLREHPRWCLELLNLTGDARMLSVEPLTTRPLLQSGLIGREADHAWLCETTTDCLLVGHPGSGKTSLLYSLTREGRGLFLVGKDPAKIAPEIRANRPGLVIVDDAHVDLEVLPRLLQLRRELSADFRIMASAWPGDRTRVAVALGLPSIRIRELGRLERDQIVEILHSIGLLGSTQLIREIVDQSRGLPGLAVTLANLCRNDGVMEVALGTALKRSVHAFLENLIGETAIDILAALALGGASGIAWAQIARDFRLPIVDSRRMIVNLEASGVVVDIDAEHVAVQPATLRHALVRDEFFSGPARLDCCLLIQAARRITGVAETLVGARTVGAQIPPDLLWDVARTARSDSIWVQVAGLGQAEARRVLQERPELLYRVAPVALGVVPEVTDQLLDSAVGDRRSIASNSEHPLRVIQDWVAAARPGSGQALARRKALLESLSHWRNAHGDEYVAMMAVRIAFSPQASWTEEDPGSGSTITLTFSYLVPAELLELGDLWSQWHDSMGSVTGPGWRPILELVSEWVYPDPKLITDSGEDTEVADARRRVAGQILENIAAIAAGRPGVQQKLMSYARAIGITIPNRLDPDFEILFPGRDQFGRDWQAADAMQSSWATRLADEWANREPSWVARRIDELRWEAALVQNNYPDYSDLVRRLIAEKIGQPIR